MAVSSVALAPTGSSGGVSGRGGSLGTLSLSATYRVECENKTDTAYIVLDHFFRTPSLPYNGRPYSYAGDSASAAICTGLDAKQVLNAEPPVFLVTANFASSESEDRQQNNVDGRKTDDPRQWHHDIDVSSTQITMPLEKAVYIGDVQNGFLVPGREQHVVNVVGEPFDPLPEYEVDISILRITKYAEAWNEDIARSFRGTINNDFVNINKQDYNFTFSFQPFQAKVKEYSGTFVFENGIKYWRQSLEVWVNPFGWRFELLNTGTTAYKKTLSAGGAVLPPDADEKPRKILDEYDNPIAVPMPLDARGFVLDKNQNPVYLKYAKYREVPYANIDW